ncbi:MAG: ornithine carbamoyltransferase [Acidimicrobiia bacterium]|nr:ornithine carbamoyltransferase [Acidimicrobiia bacterium]MDH3396197.1 ornithine carbamoyltransferase [Acidimicrobiia bacterium]
MDLLRIADLEPGQLAEILARAASVKSAPQEVAGRLAGKHVGLFFMKPSTRTRVSTETATVDLGAYPVVLGQQEVGLGKREAVNDVARVLDRYLDVLALRVFDHADLVAVAEHADAPVINLLSDEEHPCQALADLQTIAESRPLAGSTLAYLGDGNNVCHSLMVGAAMSGMTVRVATPQGYEPQREYLETARAHGDVTVTDNPLDAVRGAHVVYTDVWASMGQEEEAEARARRFYPFQVNGPLFAMADPEAVFMHCLPAHRGDEVTDEVMDHARSRVYDQAENRMHSFKGLLVYLFE